MKGPWKWAKVEARGKLTASGIAKRLGGRGGTGANWCAGIISHHLGSPENIGQGPVSVQSIRFVGGLINFVST